MQGHSPAISTKIEGDMTRPFEEIMWARRNHVSEEDFKRTVVAGWALLKSSKEPKFRTVLVRGLTQSACCCL